MDITEEGIFHTFSKLEQISVDSINKYETKEDAVKDA
jgi:hypothetical protein